MEHFIEKHIASFWNRRIKAERQPAKPNALDLGAQVVDGEPTRNRVTIDQHRRAEHLALLGKTGTGKSSLIRYLAQQDIRAGRGFLFFDLHGDVTLFLVKTVAFQEQRINKDLSGRLIVIDPADADCSVGINPLEILAGKDRFVEIAEFAQILKERWHLESFGARTDELLRNALYVLAENGLTLIELAPLLSDADFRNRCLACVTNADVREYFELRYNQLSDAMRRVMSEPALNKISLFISDAKFRHLLGQQHSTFSLVDAIDRKCWIILNLDKGRLGEHALTFGSLFLTKAKHAFFMRTMRDVFSLYVDEVQNLVSFGGALETLLAEIRKRSGAVVSANQYLGQYPADVQAAILAAGSFGFFQLSGGDAQHIAAMLDGGKSLAERLKNLPRRHLIAKPVDGRWQETLVPTIEEPAIDPTDLYERSRARWAGTRQAIEEEIRARRGVARPMNSEALDGWE